MYDAGKKSNVTLPKVMEERRELIITLRAETPQACRGTRGRSLVGGVCGGKGSTSSRRGPQGAQVCVTLCADRVPETKAGHLLASNCQKMRTHLQEAVGTGCNIHT